MNSIYILEPGLSTSVQDLGRPGYENLGISPSGGADPLALRIGNRLVQNPPSAACLEMTLMGGTFRFESEILFALTGADSDANLDGEPVAPWKSHVAKPGQIL